jgi:S-(hydroxymethyl)glutathione dehydrogenase / alcohol dehydrogenase
MASKTSQVSRRRMLKAAGALAAADGASALFGGSVPGQQGGPAVLTGTQAGRRFRAYVKFGPALPTVVELRTRALTQREILVRVEAAQTCYTSVDECLIPGTPAAQATIVGHGGVGVVEAVGPQVISTQVGDRVVVNLHAACGRCWNCLWGQSSQCLNRGAVSTIPTCEMMDGTPVWSATGAMSELTIVQEEEAVPVFTDVSPAEMSMLTCVGGCGLGMTMMNCPIEVASDVVIFGAGPVGLAAVQGAKNGWGRDDDHFQDTLVDRIREMCKPKNTRLFAGGGRVGPDHVIDAAGGDKIKPKVEQGPDPTGLTSLQQGWSLLSRIGTFVTCSVGHPDTAMVQIPADQFADSSKHHWASTGGGTNDRRDVPRYIKLIESRQLNMKALVGKTYPLNQAREAYQVCADRTVVATVVTPNA